MILDALVRYYQAVDLPHPGWSKVKVSYGLWLNDNGDIINIASYVNDSNGKRKKATSKILDLPEKVTGRTSTSIKPNFLWDNSMYILGIVPENKNSTDDLTIQKNKIKRAKKCFEAAKALHQKILAGVDSPAAKAVLAYFEHWNPDTALSHPEIVKNPNLTAGGNLIFLFGDDLFSPENNEVQKDPAIRQAWEAYKNKSPGNSTAFCPVLGQNASVARLHIGIQGIRGAQPSGAPFVSFNQESFCSYGKTTNDKGENAGISQQAAFAYTTALNYLLSEHPSHLWNTATQEKVDPQKSRFRYASQLGDTTVVYWAEGGSPAYQELFRTEMDDADTQSIADAKVEIKGVLDYLTHGKPVDIQGFKLDPGVQFYILGISPNKTRLSVRFFLQDNFGVFLQRIQEHQQRLEIVKPAKDPRDNLSFWQLLQETVNPKGKDKNPSPLLSGALARSVLAGLPYPAALLEGVFVRIRAERKITRGKAAILKAYYLKNPNPSCPKEVLTVALNKESKIIPYHLGRWFAVLEAIQQDANPDKKKKDKNAKEIAPEKDSKEKTASGVGSSIRNRYFTSAATTPAVVFALLVQLFKNHLEKLEEGQKIYYQKLIQEIVDHLPDELPARLSLPEQASFYLGYYHQVQDNFTSKKEKAKKED